ncbi:MAG: rhodanese-like domain-containing protein [Ardenticatenaceae bacterium]|nr:rhodanese-like domain-containing protein [Ardenticatenaceae bacterium]MCB9444414.1 rhodanese-like domain-containing protein [Ardenticatenaceae bacterium]
MGLFDWLFGSPVRQISPQEAYELLQTAVPPLLVDVRQPAETQTERVEGAALIPLTEFGRRYRELPRDRQILTICRSSHRSPIAARRLAKAGYDVLDVAGGLNAWQAAGLPLSKNGQHS